MVKVVRCRTPEILVNIQLLVPKMSHLWKMKSFQLLGYECFGFALDLLLSFSFFFFTLEIHRMLLVQFSSFLCTNAFEAILSGKYQLFKMFGNMHSLVIGL